MKKWLLWLSILFWVGLANAEGRGFVLEKTSSPLDKVRSFTQTPIIRFQGKPYEIRFVYQRPLYYEYFLKSEKTDSWTELIDFQVIPVDGNIRTAMDAARAKAMSLKDRFKNTHCEFSLKAQVEDEAYLDCTITSKSSSGDVYFEFSGFKFHIFEDKVIQFHYAKNIPIAFKLGDNQATKDFLARFRQMRLSVLAALFDFPTYQP